ncbi:MAG: hypothetical protein AB7Y74_13915 [Syntrophorhabdus sp.]|jgi:hypothetical protein
MNKTERSYATDSRTALSLIRMIEQILADNAELQSTLEDIKMNVLLVRKVFGPTSKKDE